jgi:hypothetical protein
VIATAPQIYQLSPRGVARCERLSHDETEPLIPELAASDLRRESQELLVDQVLGVKIAQQSRPSLDEHQLAGA